jgi:hypothetical protein
MKESEKIGEVLEANTTSYIAQSYELFKLPPLGSLVKTRDGETTIYGIVSGAETGGIEPGRRPIARGEDKESEEEIYKTNPQLDKLLKSEFEVLVIGHKEGDAVRHYLPPHPARIHDFVHLCNDDEIKTFSSSFGFLEIIINSSSAVPAEELAAAALRRMSLVQEDNHGFLVASGKELANLLSGDLNRLKAILKRMNK